MMTVIRVSNAVYFSVVVPSCLASTLKNDIPQALKDVVCRNSASEYLKTTRPLLCVLFSCV